jgi:DNA-binding protein H-NS
MSETSDDIVAVKHQFREVTKTIPNQEVAVAESATTTPTCKDPLQGGNAAEIREVLEEFVKYSELVQRMGIFVRDSLVKITTKARDALAKPPRNCDVGTPKEQSMRFRDYCLDHQTLNTNCLNCPLYKETGRCELIWAQMPYEKEGEA